MTVFRRERAQGLKALLHSDAARAVFPVPERGALKRRRSPHL